MTRLRYLMMSGLALGIGCSRSNNAVRPDEVSAAAHRQNAAQDRQAAHNEVELAQSPALDPNLSFSGGGNPQGYYSYPAEMYDPKNEHLTRAQLFTRHAQEHEAATVALEKFEQAARKDFPPVTRAECPLLGPVVGLVDVPGGIRMRFKNGIRVDAVVAHMRCHFLCRGSEVGAAAGCPLYIRGTEIRQASDPTAVEIVGRNAAATAEIRSRAREEAVLVHAGVSEDTL